ncbi:hypothetical protein [Oxynema sp. CENA135]|nr:hypothetical protein [Oxynema sp. CENA135]
MTRRGGDRAATERENPLLPSSRGFCLVRVGRSLRETVKFKI